MGRDRPTEEGSSPDPLPHAAGPSRMTMMRLASPVSSSSWPGLSRPSTSLLPRKRKTWMPATSAGMTSCCCGSAVPITPIAPKAIALPHAGRWRTLGLRQRSSSGPISSVVVLAERGGELVVVFDDDIDVSLVLDVRILGLQRHVEVFQRLLLLIGFHLLVGLDLRDLALDDRL